MNLPTNLRRVLVRLLTASAMGGCVSCALCAQVAPPSGSVAAGPAQDAMRVTAVLNGHGSDGLQKQDVALLDNGSPTALLSFEQLGASGTPTHVILVIDDVNAKLTTIAYERSELKKFLTRNDGHLSVPFSVAVMTDTKTDIQQGFSQDGVKENEALQQYKIGLHELRRDAQYGGFDRANIGVESLVQLVRYAATIPGHKMILFISPGWPLLSGPRVDLPGKIEKSILATVASLQDSMLEADVTLNMINPFGPGENLARSDYYEAFTKGVKKPNDTDIADLSLQVLVSHSGGTVQQGSSDITGMMDRVLGDLSRSYTLTFRPGPGDEMNGYHALKLQVSRPDVTVRMADE